MTKKKLIEKLRDNSVFLGVATKLNIYSNKIERFKNDSKSRPGYMTSLWRSVTNCVGFTESIQDEIEATYGWIDLVENPRYHPDELRSKLFYNNLQRDVPFTRCKKVTLLDEEIAEWG